MSMSDSATPMMRAHRLGIFVMGTLVALAGMSACASDEPAVCASVAELRSTLGNVEDVNLGENGLVELQDILVQLKDDVVQIGVDARQQYGAQLDAVTDAATDVEESLRAASTDLSPATREGVVSAIATLRTGLASLQQAVADTC